MDAQHDPTLRDDDESPTPPRGHDWFAFRTLHDLDDEDEPVTPRMTRTRHGGASRPSAPSSLTPPLGVTIPQPGSAWGMASIMTGTFCGVVALLAAYSFTLTTSAPSPPLEKAFARASVDVNDDISRAEAVASISDLVRAYAPACIGHPVDEVTVVVRRSAAGRLELMSVPNLFDPVARRCLATVLGEVNVRPSVQAHAPWTIDVELD